jgi:hypothetical protein
MEMSVSNTLVDEMQKIVGQENSRLILSERPFD